MTNSLTIAIPTFNGEPYIKDALKSIFSQSLNNFNIVISDDCSTDNTLKVIKQFKDKRIKIFQNKKNLGYGKNLQVLRKKINADIIFLMGQDDILLKHALKKTYLPFIKDKSLGIVARSYYWFDKDILKPVRITAPYDWKNNKTVFILDNKKVIKKFFESTAQLSGIVFRNNLTKIV